MQRFARDAYIPRHRQYAFAALNSFDGLDLERNKINPARRFACFLLHSLPLLRLTVTELRCLTYGVQSITVGKEIAGYPQKIAEHYDF
jgi:hypothetical protein